MMYWRRNIFNYNESAIDGESRYVDGIFPSEDGFQDFTPLGKVYPYTTWFRILAGWSSIPINAIRFYLTGKDLDN